MSRSGDLGFAFDQNQNDFPVACGLRHAFACGQLIKAKPNVAPICVLSGDVVAFAGQCCCFAQKVGHVGPFQSAAGNGDKCMEGRPWRTRRLARQFGVAGRGRKCATP